LATNPGSGNGETTAPQRAEAQDFNTTRSNRQNSALATNPGSGNGETTAPQPAEAQDFNTTRSNRERGQLAARPGNPIGGIIVKGGKNPGGQLFTTTTNESGEFSFDVSAPGTYSFRISNPVKSDKGINEAGIKKTEVAAGKGKRTYTGGRKNEPQESVAGGPLKGIDVKLGKNPNNGIQMRAVTNEQGEAEFDIPEAGSYKIIIQTPEKMNESKPSKKKKEIKVKEKYDSGLKDTLKTNV
jgi:hypothetical protein